MMAFLSVITVVKDDPDGFERSMASLLAQTFTDWELVIVDGSRDRAEIGDSLRLRIWPQAPTYRWREPGGVYDAMNAGLELAQGKFVYFLNAGDTLHSMDVLARTHELLGPSTTVWGHGPVAIRGADGSTVVTPDWDYSREKTFCFSRGRFPAHQGTFARREALVAVGGFDTRYRIAADYAAFLRLSLVADPVHLPFVVATFSEGGLSTVRWRESFREFHRARRSILEPRGVVAWRERWQTVRHFGLVYAHREIRPKLPRYRCRPSPVEVRRSHE